MDAQRNDLKERTRLLALAVVTAVRDLPRTREADVMAKQLLRSGTSVAANYRAACRARSHAEFVSRIGVVEEEADESAFWAQLLIDTGHEPGAPLRGVCGEVQELTAIAVASIRTARSRAKP